MKPLAKRTDELRQSNIRAVSMMVEAAGGINLGQGICDLPTPPQLRTAAQMALDENRSSYSHYAGIHELRRVILNKARTFNQIPINGTDEIVVSVGSTGAFATTMMAILDPGDEVVLFEPFYGYHRKLVVAMGGKPISVRQAIPSWSVDFDEFERSVTPATKAVVITTPGNPNGKVWTIDELGILLEIAARHDLYLVTDEIYEYITYDGRRHVSAASLPGGYERTITISGFSKTYNMTGWRLGYAIALPPVIEKIGLLNDLFYICAPTPLQYGVAAATEMNSSYYDTMRADYDAKRKLMCVSLESIGFDVPWPEGAYYVLASFRSLQHRADGFEDDETACRTLIDRCGVGSVAGSSFFSQQFDGSHFLRFCYAKEMRDLRQACDRLVDVFG